MPGRLPPIFARYRFGIPKPAQPGVVFVVTPEMDREVHDVIEQMDNQDMPTEHFVRWWIEYHDMGILAQTVGETEYLLQWFGRKAGPDKPFVFDTKSLHDDTWPLDDMQKVAAASYVRGAILLQIYTERERDVSVNTMTRNRPRAFIREGDTMRFAPLDSLASAAGHHRQRGYVRPNEASGIRMKEHDVRGHWRTYSSGVRVWVRSHKRGDAELGRVKRTVM